jgi:hypothetical protein
MRDYQDSGDARDLLDDHRFWREHWPQMNGPGARGRANYGQAAIQIEWQKCPSCGGTRKERSVDLRCMTCRGKGRLPLNPGRFRGCEQCDGKGYLLWGDNPEDVEQIGDGAYRNIRDPQKPVNFVLCWCCDGWGIVLRAKDSAETATSPLIRDLRKTFLMLRQSGDSFGARSCCSCLARVTRSARSKRAATRRTPGTAARAPKCGANIASTSTRARCAACAPTADRAVSRTDRDSRYPSEGLGL